MILPPLLIMLGFVGLLARAYSSNTLLVGKLGFLIVSSTDIGAYLLNPNKKKRGSSDESPLVYLLSAEPLRECILNARQGVMVP